MPIWILSSLTIFFGTVVPLCLASLFIVAKQYVLGVGFVICGILVFCLLIEILKSFKERCKIL
ncbi:MAG: hypothetical protein E7062_08560 [Spirochaetaceae bacterium]|nr:hypothetical protein [Spirochaetaceae bacterium]